MKKQIFFEGSGSFKHIGDIVADKKIMVVAGASLKKLPVYEYLKSAKLQIVFFQDFSPNPLAEDIEKGKALFKDENCEFMVSIGGGSAIDVAKCILLDGDTVRFPHLAMPTTAGTGSESTHFAVMYKAGEKHSVAHCDLLPDYVILDPDALKTLPLYQKKCTMLDALCQGIESMWSVNSTQQSREYAQNAIRLILPNIAAYLHGDEYANITMMTASNFSGRAINISQTTAAHALSYKISSLFSLPHGHAVALVLPEVMRYMAANTNLVTDKRGKDYMLDIFRRLCKIFFVEDIDELADYLDGLLLEMDLLYKGAVTQKQINELVLAVNAQRLRNNPVEIPQEGILSIYQNVFSV